MSSSTVSPAPLTPAIRSPRSASPAPGGRSGTPSLSSLRGGGPHVDRHQSVPDDVVELMGVAQALLVEAMLHQSRAFAFLLLGHTPPRRRAPPHPPPPPRPPHHQPQHPPRLPAAPPPGGCAHPPS